MKRARFLAVFVVAGCSRKGGDDLVILPPSGWVDGCTPVEIAGPDLDGAEVLVGGSALAEPFTLDRGVRVGGLTPPGSAGEASVEVTVRGAAREVPGGFVYEPCPQEVWIDGVVDADGDGSIGTDGAVELRGCGFVDGLSVVIGDAAPVALSQSCGAGRASFEPPYQPNGVYAIRVVDADGQELFPGGCTTCGAVRLLYGAPPASPVDSGDTGAADTGAP
jgi:hypothetical protein